MFPSFLLFFYLLCVLAVHMLRFIYFGWFLPYLELVMLCVPPLVLLLSLPSMISVKIKQLCPRYAEQGKPGEVRLTLESRIPFTLGQVKLRSVTENRFTGETELSTADYLNLSRETLLLSLPTDACGRLEFRLTGWICYDLLSFFSLRKRLPEALICTVLPAAAPPQAGFSLDGALNSIPVLKPKTGGFAEDYDLREYRYGDTPNSIHWKLSSKVDKLIVREALIPENTDIFLVLTAEGDADKNLGLIRWLSSELCRRELPHYIVSAEQYPVENEQAGFQALVDILSSPLSPPCSFDASKARCVLTVSSGEVHLS